VEANGFQLFHWPYSNICPGSGYADTEKYCKEMADLLAKELEAEEVFVFDFQVECFQVSKIELHC